MPRQFDLHPVPIDRDPLWSLYTGSAIPNLPKLEINAEFMWQAFINGVKALTGIDLSSWEALLDSLREQFNLDVADAMRVVTNLKTFFANAVDLSEIDFDPQQAARDFVRFIVQPLLRVIDQIKAALLGPVPIGLLTDQLDTLVLEGGFEAPETIAEGSGWVHDEMDGGCAMVECDGTDHQMSSSFIRVAPGWQLELSARWHWQGLTAAPESLRIELQPWADESTPVGAPIVLLSAGSASGSSGGWQAMTAPSLYSVPATGVRFVTLVPRVTDNATAGTVRLKDVKLVAVQRIPQNFTVDLPEDLASLFNWIGSLVDQLLARLGITPTGGLLDRIFDLADELALIQETAEDAVSTIGELLSDLVSNPQNVIPTVGDLVEGFMGMWQSWFSFGSPPSSPQDAAVETVEAIRAAVSGGFTLQTFTASNGSWPVPAELKNATEAYAGAIGGGGRGAQGDQTSTQEVTAFGGVGGSSGGYVVERFDPSSLGDTLAVTIGAGAATAGQNGGVTSIVDTDNAATLVESVPNIGAIATPLGYQVSASAPGRGGKGGDALMVSQTNVFAENGSPGESSGAASGGTGGTGSAVSGGTVTAGNGGSGANGQTNNTPISGGGGGGGGGGAASHNWIIGMTATAGNGGNGGYPGGGSGGGGGLAAQSLAIKAGGNPGVPANGFAFLLWR